jgi:RNA-directed DNA polymerase
MSNSLLLQASFATDTLGWHSINWAGCHRRVRSLQRRIVQATKAGVRRKAKRLNYLLVHSQDARLLAVKRVTGNKGGKTPGVDGEVCPGIVAILNARPPRYDALPTFVGTGRGR